MRVSRLFLRGGSRSSKKSKSTDFGFFLYLLAKTAFYWLFFQNNHGFKANLFYEILAFALVLFRNGTKQVKKSTPKCAFDLFAGRKEASGKPTSFGEF